MVSWTPVSTQVDALGLDSSSADFGVLVSSWTSRQSLGIGVNTARIASREIRLLLWLGLSATRPVHRPIAPDDAFLCLCGVLCRSVAGAKYVRENKHHFWHDTTLSTSRSRLTRFPDKWLIVPTWTVFRQIRSYPHMATDWSLRPSSFLQPGRPIHH